MKIRINNRLLRLSLLTSMGLFLLTACNDKNNNANKAAEQSPVLVKTLTLHDSIDTTKRVYPGYVVANKKVDLAFQVPGQIHELPIVEGQFVDKGARLAALDRRDYDSRFTASKARLVKAKQDYERAKTLVGNGTIPESAFDASVEKYNIARSDKAQAEKALNDTDLLAPFSGVIANVYVENFENIHAKELILSLQDISHIDIEVSVPEQDVIRLKPTRQEKAHGKTIEGDVTFNGIPDKRFKASIKEYSTQADRVSQTYQITLTMPMPEHINILPGMNANIHVTLPDQYQSSDAVFIIPMSAVLTDNTGQHYVWIVNNNKVNKLKVHIDKLGEHQAHIKGALNQGDKLVIAGINQLSDNQSVIVMERKE